MLRLHPSSILVVMALDAEARGVAELAGPHLLLTGVGKVNATFALTRKLNQLRSQGAVPELVVNFGTAGSRNYSTGSVLECVHFVQRDMDATGLGFALGHTPFDDVPARISVEPVFSGLPKAVCGSADRFDTGQGGLECDAIEMEAYALSKVCKLEGVRFACAKYITDGADPSAANDWAAQLPRAAAQFAALYRSLIGV